MLSLGLYLALCARLSDAVLGRRRHGGTQDEETSSPKYGDQALFCQSLAHGTVEHEAAALASGALTD
jgi:hypothetical protein